MKTSIFISTLFLMLVLQTKASTNNDTMYHYFSNGNLSVKIEPMSDRQLIRIYNLKGEEVYQLENVRMSYSVSNKITFRANGSVEKVNTHTNPGASMYFYESEILFDTDNTPTFMRSFRKPTMSINDAMGDKYLWDINKGGWVKQEIVACQPVPHH
jgi:hypothetical protein